MKVGGWALMYESSDEAKEKTQIFYNLINCDFKIE